MEKLLLLVLYQLVFAYIWYTIGCRHTKRKAMESNVTFTRGGRPVAYAEWKNDGLELTVYDKKVAKVIN